jgi:predicted permease
MSIRRFFQRSSHDVDLAQEIQSHIAHDIDENIARGIPREEATRLANLKFGNPQRVREEVWRWNTMEFLDSVWRDVRFTLRGFRRQPGFVIVALLTLALGTGATTLMFTLINGILFKPLAYAHPERLVAVHGNSQDWNVAVYGQQKLAYPDFLDCRQTARSLEMAAYVFNSGTVSSPGDPEYVDQDEITYNLFSVLGVNVLHGRAFLPEEDRAGGPPVMILSYGFWQRHFGGNLSVLGSSVLFDGKAYSVVGITPAYFRRQESEPDVMTPLGQDTAKYLQTRQAHPVNVVGRLRPGMTLSQAQAELTVAAHDLAAKYPDTNKDRTFVAQRLEPDVTEVRSTLWLLLGAVGLVLLIACANVASLLLARAISRGREFAMRVALGAGRIRLVRQCLTESTVLALTGGLLGVLLAVVGVHPFVRFWPGELPRSEEVQIDWHVLVFALGVSLLSSFLFGIAPALRAPARNLEQILRAGARTLSGSSRRLHGVFVAVQVTLAVVLLVSAGMLGRTLLRLSSLDPGVNVHNVLTARMALSPATLADPERTRAAWREVLERGKRVPGVQSIAVVDTVPMRRGNNPLSYWPNAALPPENKRPLALSTCVSPDYLKVMDIPLLKGRFLNDQDRLDSEKVIVVDEVMAENAFHGKDAVGKRIWIPDMNPQPLTIVGVVGHVRYWGLGSDDQSDIRAQFYYPLAQVPDQWMRRWSQLMSVAVRTEVPPLTLLQPLRRELKGATGDQVLYVVRTLEDLARASLAQQRFLLLLFGIFGALALILACVGVYGVLSYLTSQRVPEIGVRMAMGATAGHVIQLVLKQSLGMIAVGVAMGIIAAVGAGRLLLHLVDGMRSMEPLTFILMVLVLIMAALIASFVPAWRASRLDAVEALRSE